MAEMLNYDQSPTPPAKQGAPAGERNSDRGIGVDADGRMTYESASAEGMIEVMLPSLPGSARATETLHAKDFGVHSAGKIEAALSRQGYMKSGPQQGPAQVFRHYVAVAKGSKLLDEAALGHMETLAQEFEAAPEPEKFFEQTARPFLIGLTPERRK
jgi:hypothetical protein